MSTYTNDQLRTLSQFGIDSLNWINKQEQEALVKLREQRAVFEKEIVSIDAVMRDLEETIARREAMARGDSIRALPIDDGDAGQDPVPPFDPSQVELSGVGGHS